MNQKSKYWYQTIRWVCPVCGAYEDQKIRVYGDKPVDPEERFVRANATKCEWHTFWWSRG